MNKDIESILITEEELRRRVSEIAAVIDRDYAGKEPIFIGVLKGSFIFMADLLRAVTLNCDLDFMAVSSYGTETRSTGAVKIIKDLSRDIEGRDVIIVEDILDSGRTLSYLMQYLANRKPSSMRICALMDKPARREVELEVRPEYVGFSVPDEFVVGYGLDYAEIYRNLPYVGVLKPSVYEK